MREANLVFDLLAEWRGLTTAETEAIEGEAWAQLERHQARKQALKEALIQATDVWRRTEAKERTGAAEEASEAEQAEQRLREVVTELVTLESRNHEALCARREKARRQIRELDCASRNLQSVRRAYGDVPVSWWHSYS